jgi:hypothetical protein
MACCALACSLASGVPADVMRSDTRAHPFIQVVRLPDIESRPAARGVWLREDVEAGEFVKLGTPRVHLKLVAGAAGGDGDD